MRAAYEATVRTPQPSYLAPIVENMPLEDLGPYPHFVGWRPVWREGKNGKPGGWTKPPINPLTGGLAQSNVPATWGPLQAVRGVFDQFGFTVSDDDPFGFLDLDNAVDPATGKIKPWA